MEITASNFSQQFIQILDEISQRLGVVIDWTSVNVTPYLIDLINRYSKFIIFKNGFFVILALIIFSLGIYFTFKNLKTSIKTTYNCEFDNYEEVVKLVLWIFGLFLLLIGTCCILNAIPDFIKTIYVPEYYILESISGFLQ